MDTNTTGFIAVTTAKSTDSRDAPMVSLRSVRRTNTGWKAVCRSWPEATP